MVSPTGKPVIELLQAAEGPYRGRPLIIGNLEFGHSGTGFGRGGQNSESQVSASVCNMVLVYNAVMTRKGV